MPQYQVPALVNVGEVQMVSAADFNPAQNQQVEEFTLSANLVLSIYKVKESERLLLAENL